MKKVVVSFISLLSLTALAQNQIQFRTEEWQKEHGKERRGYVSFLTEKTGDVIAIRVGSPLFNRLRNVIRNDLDAGRGINNFAEALLKIEDMEGVGPNTLLVIKLKKFSGSVYEANNLRKEFPDWQMYLYDQGKGFIEIFLENGIVYGVLLPLNTVINLPLAEVLNAFSGDSIWKRYQNSGLAIWDDTKGIGYALADVPMELIEGDIARSLKALTRVPFCVVELGGTLVTKTLRLPVDLVMSGVLTIRSATNNTKLSTRDRARMVRKNSDYDVTLSFGNKNVEGEATLIRPSRGDSLLVINGERIALRWTVFENEDSFLPGMFGATFKFQEKRYLLLGSIDGRLDVEMKGEIIELQEPVELETEAIYNYFVKYWSVTEKAVGVFHFDD